ncbi:MAG: hypothetical protein H0T89_32490 [Deltaproteobacteria bacterium]|nr:hypothetical protein [Deltaproteobacteria bacterium]
MSTTIAIAGSADEPRTADHARWQLLRVWHLEAMECVIDNPMLVSFTRTSYVSAPASWCQLAQPQLVARIEQLLGAHYRVRAETLRTPEVDERMMPFAFDFEWVGAGDQPANPGARADPWLLPCTSANARLVELASQELDAKLQAARWGIDSRCYADAFEVFRIDDDDAWHIIDWDDRAAMFAARYRGEGRA